MPTTVAGWLLLAACIGVIFAAAEKVLPRGVIFN